MSMEFEFEGPGHGKADVKVLTDGQDPLGHAVDVGAMAVGTRLLIERGNQDSQLALTLRNGHHRPVNIALQWL